MAGPPAALVAGRVGTSRRVLLEMRCVVQAFGPSCGVTVTSTSCVCCATVQRRSTQPSGGLSTRGRADVSRARRLLCATMSVLGMKEPAACDELLQDM